MPTEHEIKFIKNQLRINLLAADEAAKDRCWHVMDECLEDARKYRKILLELTPDTTNRSHVVNNRGKL